MCGIAGFLSTEGLPQPAAQRILEVMSARQRHRGPDGEGRWTSLDGRAGFAHVRLKIVDLSDAAAQPMTSEAGNVVVFNGEIYNYLELRRELGEDRFRTASDTETILLAYERWGEACVERFRGMFAFALWDARQGRLFVARDRFGIKPFYYWTNGHWLLFASEMKALVPFLPGVETDLEGLHDYFCFQFCLEDRTLFSGIKQMQPAHCGYLDAAGCGLLRRYWDLRFELDLDHNERYFLERVRELLSDSVDMHLRADVEVGAYLSGGIDSSLISALAQEKCGGNLQVFAGRFALGEAFDETRYARVLAEELGLQLRVTDIEEADFASHLSQVIYHLDQPIAGPGALPQFMVSRSVRNRLKVVLGGQGGDEIFGGYVRYLIAYFEQCIKGAIDGTMDSGKYVVTYESIIPSLRTLRGYEPLLQEFWSEGIFDRRDRRYFRLIDRAKSIGDAVRWDLFRGASSFAAFQKIYAGDGIERASYFDSMTYFDFKTLLPALLHVEDRMGMAHGIEARVPFLDHPLIELSATIPANVKFGDGELKRVLRRAFADKLPQPILARKDKMGFPVPLQIWSQRDGLTRQFVLDTFAGVNARSRPYLAPGFDIERTINREGPFARNLWAFLSLELWQQQFHDRHWAERVPLSGLEGVTE